MAQVASVERTAAENDVHPLGSPEHQTSWHTRIILARTSAVRVSKPCVVSPKMKDGDQSLPALSGKTRHTEGTHKIGRCGLRGGSSVIYLWHSRCWGARKAG